MNAGTETIFGGRPSMVKRLRPQQERILQAGPPPRCDDFGSDFVAWYAAQGRW